VDPAPPGALLSAAEMGNLIRAANAFAPQPWRSPLGSSTDRVARERAIANYVQFLSEIYFAHAPGVRVVVDPNGGAACAVAERAFRALGVEPILVNDVEGEVAHEIDVEHARLNGTHVLDEIAQRVRSERALFGLAYDFDADRGNLTYVGAGALLAAADVELRAIVAETLSPGRQMAADLAGFIDLLPPQRSFMEKRAAPVDWKATVDTFNRQLPSLFASELARTWERYEIVYSRRRHVSADRPDAAGYGWKARLFRPGGEGFLWIRGSKTEAGIARLVADAPTEPEARALMDLGRRLLSMTDCGDQISRIDQRA
jgi:phosphomannomutase